MKLLEKDNVYKGLIKIYPGIQKTLSYILNEHHFEPSDLVEKFDEEAAEFFDNLQSQKLFEDEIGREGEKRLFEEIDAFFEEKTYKPRRQIMLKVVAPTSGGGLGPDSGNPFFIDASLPGGEAGNAGTGTPPQPGIPLGTTFNTQAEAEAALAALNLTPENQIRLAGRRLAIKDNVDPSGQTVWNIYVINYTP